MAETTVGSVGLDLVLNSKEFKKKLQDSVNGAVKESTKGVETSLKNTTTKLAKLARNIFVVKKLVDFGAAAVKVAETTGNAWLGLNSIISGQGRSFSEAQKYINNYISDGLIPLGNAVTAYKNLAARGYDDTQIQGIMERLKDSAAFGRQASYSLGDAVESATEGLKNENSILVDNAGVTKNVAKMWQDYAKSIGKTSNNLTMAEKRQAEYQGIMQETQFQVGDAAVLTQTYSGQVAKLTASFTTFKNSIGSGLINVLMPIIKVINELMVKVVALGEVFNRFTEQIFGKASAGTKKVASTISNLGTAATDTATSTAAAAKKIAKSIMGFDQINKLNDNSDSDSSSSSDDSSSAIPTFNNADTEKALDSTLNSSATKIKNWIKTLPTLNLNVNWELVKTNLVKGLNNVLETLKNLATLVITISINILNDLDIGKLAENLSELWESLTNLAKQISAVVTPALILFYENGVKPIVTWVGEKLADALAFVSGLLDNWATWFSNNKQGIVDFAGAIGELVAGFWALTEPLLNVAWEIGKTAIKAVSDIIQGLFSFIVEHQTGVVTAIAAVVTALTTYKIITGITAAIGAFKAILASGTIITYAAAAAQTALNIAMSLNPIALIVALIAGLVAAFVVLWKKNEAFRNFWIKMWDAIKAVVKTVIDFIIGYYKALWTAIVTIFNGVKETVSTVFFAIKDIAGNVVDGIKDKFSSVFSAIGGIFTKLKDTFGGVMKAMVKVAVSPLNNIITLVNTMITGLNLFIKAANMIKFDVPDWVPAIGGKKFEFNIPEIGKIPALAQGGYVKPNTPQLAMIGDNRHQGEIVAPEDKIRSIFSEELSGILTAINNLITAIANGNSGDSGDIYIPVTIGGTTLDNIVVTAQQRQKMRSGGR